MRFESLQEDEESTWGSLRLVWILHFLPSLLTSGFQSENRSDNQKSNQIEERIWKCGNKMNLRFGILDEIPIIGALRPSFGFTTFHLEICDRGKKLRNRRRIR